MKKFKISLLLFVKAAAFPCFSLVTQTWFCGYKLKQNEYSKEVKM